MRRIARSALIQPPFSRPPAGFHIPSQLKVKPLFFSETNSPPPISLSPISCFLTLDSQRIRVWDAAGACITDFEDHVLTPATQVRSAPCPSPASRALSLFVVCCLNFRVFLKVYPPPPPSFAPECQCSGRRPTSLLIAFQIPAKLSLLMAPLPKATPYTSAGARGPPPPPHPSSVTFSRSLSTGRLVAALIPDGRPFAEQVRFPRCRSPV
jgi:hypothetical protein